LVIPFDSKWALIAIIHLIFGFNGSTIFFIAANLYNSSEPYSKNGGGPEWDTYIIGRLVSEYIFYISIFYYIYLFKLF
jgi:hypothetical protein